MHSYFKSARRHRTFLFVISLFGLYTHSRAGSLSVSGQPAGSIVSGQLYDFAPTTHGYVLHRGQRSSTL